MAVCATQPNETLPGFRAENLLEAHGIDNVNLFSGDPGVVIPIGPEYTLSSAYKWQLRAHYSAKLWHFSGNCTADSTVRFAFLQGDATLGVGWAIQPGYVVPSVYNTGVAYKWTYLGPDGGRHEVDFGQGTTAITKDGSHLRITAIGGTQGPQGATSYTVEFPDGSKHTFDHTYAPPRPTGTQWSPDLTNLDFAETPGQRFGLSKIEDRFRNVVLQVTYDPTRPSEIASIVLTPNTQPRTISFAWSSLALSGGVTWRVLSSVLFSGFGSTQRSVAFSYQEATFPRNIYDNSRGSTVCTPVSPATIDVPELQTVSFSDPGTPSSFSSFSYTFAYFSNPSSDSMPVQKQGVLQSITLPTGGVISYDYSTTTASACEISGSCDPEATLFGASARVVSTLERGLAVESGSSNLSRFHEFLDRSVAVTMRQETDTVSGKTAVTNYYRAQFVALKTVYPFDADQDRIIRRTIVSANGNDDGTGPAQFLTRHYFHVAFLADVDSTDQPVDGGTELERRYYPAGVSTDAPVRSLITCWGSAPQTPVCGYKAGDGTIKVYKSYDLEPPRAEITWYGQVPTGSDGGSCAGTSPPCTASVNETYVPTVGKYSKTTVSSTLTAMSGWTSRVTTTAWIDPTNPALPEWILDMYTSRSVTDSAAPAPTAVTTTNTFNTNNGFLKGGTVSDGYGTLTHSYSNNGDPTGNGNGDVTPVTTAGSGAALSGSFTDTRTFQSGLPLTDQRAGITWLSFNVSRDGDTGLISTSHDPNSALTTTYAYDGLGRITSITPPTPDAATSVSYDSTTQTTVSRSGGDGNGIWQRYIYDGLGRLIREIKQMPGASQYAFRSRAYDKAGHTIFVSEWASCASPSGSCLTATALGTTNTNFDSFDRAQTITRADGTQTIIDRTDGTILFADSRENVTTTVGTANSMTTTRRDALGRIIAVTEPSVGQGTEDTTYTYNVLDKLARVSQGTQTRTFVYDSFGFLRSETTPEKGTVTYSSYDALGDVLSETQNDGTVRLRTYDAAARLTKLTAGGSVFLRNCYDGQSPCVDGVPVWAGGTYPLGKLTRRYGYNPTSSPALTITDDLTYSDAVGRLSVHASSFDSGVIASATQKWFYNSFGLVIQHAHARPSGTPFVVSTSYSQGLPATLYANGIPIVIGIGYQASGAVGGYTTGPGIASNVVTAIVQDPTGIPRPSQIKAQPVGSTSALFDTGAYSYDGVGNILGMGLDAFAYDARSRLCKAALSGPGNQFYAYDRFGNLITKAFSDPGTCASSTSWSNNRVPTATYDQGAANGRGNLTSYLGTSYTFDTLDRLTGTTGWAYLFDGADERVVKIPSGLGWTYTFRDGSNQLSAEFVEDTSVSPHVARQSRDNVFLGNLLVASYANPAVTGNGPVWAFFSSDHLGTPRLVTNVAGTQVEPRRYWPYGDEIGTPSSSERIRFAAMERDTEDPTYYDHARNHEFNLGRFLSADRVVGNPARPQRWNRYAYALNNPLNLVDPDGKKEIPSWVWDILGHAVDYVLDKLASKKLEKTTKKLNTKLDSVAPDQEGLRTKTSENSGAGPLTSLGDYLAPKWLEFYKAAVNVGEHLAEAFARHRQKKFPDQTGPLDHEADKSDGAANNDAGGHANKYSVYIPTLQPRPGWWTQDEPVNLDPWQSQRNQERSCILCDPPYPR